MTVETEDRLRVATLHLAQAVSKVAQAIAIMDDRQRGGPKGLLSPAGDPRDAVAEAYASLDRAIDALGASK